MGTSYGTFINLQNMIRITKKKKYFAYFSSLPEDFKNKRKMSFFPKIAFQYEVEEYLTKVFRNSEVCGIVTPSHEKLIIFCVTLMPYNKILSSH